MNYKTLLMASAAVLFSSQAMAQDLTGAFSVPGKGQIMSETSMAMSRAKTKFNVSASLPGATIPIYSAQRTDDGLTAGELIEYGITDKFSVNAGIVNVFDTGRDQDYNNDHNFEYQVGAKYNTRFDDVLFQVAGHYNTWNPKDFYGHNTDMRWQKSLGLDLKAGLDLGNGITPYIVYSIDSAIDTAHRPLTQSVSAGIHKYTGKWALDGAIRYEWDKNSKDYTGKNRTETWFDGAADYYLKDNIAIGVYGSYLIDAHDSTMSYGFISERYHTNFDYSVGLRVKVLF